MISSTSAFNAQIKKDSRTFRARLLNNEVPISGAIKRIVINKGACGEPFSIGSVYSPYIEVTLDDCEELLENKELLLQIGLVIDDTVEHIDMGYYTVTKPSRSTYQTTFTAVGRITSKLNCLPTLPAEQTLANLAAAITEATGVQIICKGVTLAGTIAEDLTGLTCGELLEVITAVLGGFATEDNAGNIVISKFSTDDQVGFNGDRTITAAEFNDYDYELTGVKVIVTEEWEDEDGIVHPEVSFIEGTPRQTLSIKYMTESLFSAFKDNVVGYTYRPGTIPLALGDPRLEPWDCILYADAKGNAYVVPCLSIVHTFDGGLSTTITAPGESESEASSTVAGPITQQLERMNSLLITAQEAIIKRLKADDLEAEVAKLGYASVKELQAVNATIESLKAKDAEITGKLTADEAEIQTLKAKDLELTGQLAVAVADITNLKAKDAEIEGTLKATNAEITDLEAKAITTDNLSAKVATLGYATVDQLEATEGRIDNLSAKAITTDNLSAKVGEFGYLKAADLESEVGTFGYLKADDLEAEVAEFGYLKANSLESEVAKFGYAKATDLEAMNASIQSLQAEDARIAGLFAGYATVGDLNATNADIEVLVGNQAEFEEATAQNFTAVNAAIDSIKADYVKTTELEAESADIRKLFANYATVSQLNATNGNIETLRSIVATINSAYMDEAEVEELVVGKGYLTEAQVNTLVAGKGYFTEAQVDDLVVGKGYITTAQTNTLLSDYVKTSTLTADYIKASDIASTYATIKNLDAQKARIDTIVSDYVKTDTLEANYITSSAISSTYATIKNLDAVSASLGTLSSKAITTDNLSAKVATLGYLKAADLEAEVAEFGYLKASLAAATYATISNLSAANGQITSLSSKVATIESAYMDEAAVNTLVASKGYITTLATNELLSEYVKTSTLTTNYATINSLNAAIGRIGNIEADYVKTDMLVGKYVLVEDILTDNITSSTGNFTKYLTGVQIHGDLIYAETLKAGSLILRGEDGIYRRLNIDSLGETVVDSDSKYNEKLDGSVLVAESITATQIAAGTITATQIKSGSITVDRLNADQLKARVGSYGYLESKNLSAEVAKLGYATVNSLNAVDGKFSNYVLISSYSADKSTLESSISAADSKATTANSVLANWCYNNNTTFIDGGKIYTGTIKAEAIDADTLSAISADLGTVTAGILQSKNFAMSEYTVDKEGNVTKGEVLEGLKIDLDNKAYYTPQITIKDNYIDVNGHMTIGKRVDELGSTDYAIGKHSLSVGLTIAEGDFSFAAGADARALGQCSVALGAGQATGRNSFAVGLFSWAKGDGSFAMGTSFASGIYSCAIGLLTSASGGGAFAQGTQTSATGSNSFAQGSHTEALSSNQHVYGRYNIADSDGVYAHIVGNGTDYNAHSNAHTLTWEGDAWYAGDVIAGGTQATDGSVTGGISLKNHTHAWDSITGKPSTFTPASHTHSYLPLSGGTLTGNLTGQYITGTWLQGTASNHLSSAGTKFVVQDSAGWLYHRTAAEVLSDIGAAASGHTHTLDYRLQAAQSTATGSDANSATATGFHYINGTTNRPSFNQNNGVTGNDYRILTTAYSASWLQQIATDFRCDDIFYRRNQNGTWQSWRRIAFADECATSGHNHDSTYAKLTSPNNMIHNGNEVTWVPKGYNNYIWLNYRTGNATGQGTVTGYKFGNGNGGVTGVTVWAETFSGNLSGNATTATTATKLGSSTVGGTGTPIYLNAGTATACSVRNTTSKSALGWTSTTADAVLVTANTIAYWNGAYAGTSSNLTYCVKGAFGDMATKTASDYLAKAGGTMTGEITIGQGDGYGMQLGTGGRINATTSAGSTTATVLGLSGTQCYIGHSSFNATMRGAGTRPTYNGSNLALSSDLNSYLPLSGGTLTGTLSAPKVAASGDSLLLSVGSRNLVFTLASDGTGAFRPETDGGSFCGTTTYPWSYVYTNNLVVKSEPITCKPTYDNTVTNATNVYVTTKGVFSRTTNTSSRTIKHDIDNLSAEDIKAEKLYDLDVVQFKYNEGVITDTEDARYGKTLPGFIIEDMNQKYPIAVDKPGEDVKEWSWNPQYMLPPMLKLIQNQHKEDIRMASEIDIVKAKLDRVQIQLDAAMMKIAEQEKQIEQLMLVS